MKVGASALANLTVSCCTLVLFHVAWDQAEHPDYAEGVVISNGVDDSDITDFVKLRQGEGTVRYGESKIHMDVPNEDFFKVWYVCTPTPTDPHRGPMASERWWRGAV